MIPQQEKESNPDESAETQQEGVTEDNERLGVENADPGTNSNNISGNRETNSTDSPNFTTGTQSTLPTTNSRATLNPYDQAQFTSIPSTPLTNLPTSNSAFYLLSSHGSGLQPSHAHPQSIQPEPRAFLSSYSVPVTVTRTSRTRSQRQAQTQASANTSPSWASTARYVGTPYARSSPGTFLTSQALHSARASVNSSFSLGGHPVAVPFTTTTRVPNSSFSIFGAPQVPTIPSVPTTPSPQTQESNSESQVNLPQVLAEMQRLRNRVAVLEGHVTELAIIVARNALRTRTGSPPPQNP